MALLTVVEHPLSLSMSCPMRRGAPTINLRLDGLLHAGQAVKPECTRRRSLTDRLSLTNALADANIDRKAAERIATEIFDAIHGNVATKADVAAVNADL